MIIKHAHIQLHRHTYRGCSKIQTFCLLAMEKIRASTNHNKISDSLWNLKGLTCVLTIIIQLRDCMFHKLFEEEGKTVPKQK